MSREIVRPRRAWAAARDISSTERTPLESMKWSSREVELDRARACERLAQAGFERRHRGEVQLTPHREARPAVGEPVLRVGEGRRFGRSVDDRQSVPAPGSSEGEPWRLGPVHRAATTHTLEDVHVGKLRRADSRVRAGLPAPCVRRLTYQVPAGRPPDRDMLTDTHTSRSLERRRVYLGEGLGFQIESETAWMEGEAIDLTHEGLGVAVTLATDVLLPAVGESVSVRYTGRGASAHRPAGGGPARRQSADRARDAAADRPLARARHHDASPTSTGARASATRAPRRSRPSRPPRVRGSSARPCISGSCRSVPAA